MSFKNIVLGSSAHKNYTHDMSFDNNTTMDFGSLQPILAQYMEPNSKISVNARQLVRLAPMPLPSFARISLLNYSRFVKMSDVVPYHECLLAKRPYYSENGVYTPDKMPVTTNRMLQFCVLLNSHFTIYESKTQFDDYYQYVKFTPLEDNLSSICTKLTKYVNFGKVDDVYSGFSISKATNTMESDVTIFSKITHITPLSADYVLYFTPDGEAYDDGNGNSKPRYMVCFLYDDAGKRLRKQLIGLGYSLSFEDVAPLSLAPLLAYYKAYFDTFGLTRNQPFETTNAFRLIKNIEDYKWDYTHKQLSQKNQYISNFFAFISSLTECYYSSSNSYIAAHRTDIMNNEPMHDLSVVGSQNVVSSVDKSLPLLSHLTKGINQISLDALKRLTRYVAKDSVIGQRISDWVKVHYGADVSNSLFAEAFRINEWSTSVDVDDVMSQSDTVLPGSEPNTTTGEHLGAYAGKGVGFNKTGFSFKAPVHGFVFVLSCIVPKSNLFIGNDPTLYAIDNDTIPRPEFDALGFEITDGHVFYSDNGVNYPEGFDIPRSFGFIPRYTGFKIKKNVVNGDMYSGPCKTDLQPYYLDQLITSRPTSFTHEVSTDLWKYGNLSKFAIDNHHNIGASTAWQQICRYPFMGNYNRIFYNSSVDSTQVFPLSDNFIVQTVFDVKLSNWMKPVQNSYDTVDDIDNSSTKVETN